MLNLNFWRWKLTLKIRFSHLLMTYLKVKKNVIFLELFFVSILNKSYLGTACWKFQLCSMYFNLFQPYAGARKSFSILNHNFVIGCWIRWAITDLSDQTPNLESPNPVLFSWNLLFVLTCSKRIFVWESKGLIKTLKTSKFIFVN